MGARTKRAILVGIGGLLVGSAGIGIAMILLEPESDTGGRLLASSVLVPAFVLAWLLSAAAYERGRFAPIGIGGMAVSPAGVVFALLLVWEAIEVTSFSTVKPLFVLVAVTVALAYASILLAGVGESRLADLVAAGAIASVWAIAGIVITLALAESTPTGSTGKALGVLGVVAVLGTFLVPMARKLDRLAPPPPPPSRPDRIHPTGV